MTSSMSDREMSLTRLIDAPRERVWEAWTKPEHLGKWYGPNGFTITTESFDFREGGKWVFMMHGPDGRDYPNWIVFTKLEKPARIEHDHGGDEGGDVQFKAVITFEEQDGKTLVTLRNIFPTAEALAHVVKEYGAIEGGKQTLGRLDAYVSAL